MDKVRILLLDDHQIFLDGMKVLLSSVDWIELVDGVTDTESAYELLRSQSIQVVIADLNLPGEDGISFISKASKEFPRLKIIALTMIEEGRVVFECLEAGADGYLLKNTNLQELTSAIKAVLAGEPYLNAGVNKLLVDQLRNENSREDELTVREREVLRLIVKGKSSKIIADELGLSIDTIKFHRKNILSKLGQPNVAALVSYAIENGLV